MWGFVVFCGVILCVLILRFYLATKPNNKALCFSRRKITPLTFANNVASRFKAKPDWVKKEIIQLKALMRNEGCRKIAGAFNRQFEFSKQMTVGKTFVAKVIREHQYEIQVLHKKIKQAPPKSVARQLIWGVDLTFKQTSDKNMLPILGLVEHHSRKSLTLSALKDKSTITLLGYLFKSIEKYGKPKIIRTDNEAVFTSKLFTLSLWLLGIKHQTTDLHSPWQNGRVERFFGTLKEKLNQWSVDSLEQFNQDLHLFQFWYNKVRTHNNLNGKTPEEVWANINTQHYSSENAFYFNEWEGLLSGFYHPP